MTAKITINGQEITKEKPTIQDWIKHLETQEKLQGKNFLADKKSIQYAYESVADYFGISVQDIEKTNDLEEFATAYYAINKSILECFGNAKKKTWGEM